MHAFGTRSRTARITGRVSIGIASAAIAVTTFGAASASAATVSHLPSNSTAISHQVLPKLPVHGGVALEAFPAGGKGSGSAKTCAHFTKIINQAEKGFQSAVKKGDAYGAGQAAVLEDSLINGATDAGCAVITAD